MQEVPSLVLGLPAPDHELALLERDLELIAGEARDGQGDAQALRVPLGAGQPLDVVGRVSVPRGLGDAIERLLDLVEPQEEGIAERRLTRHGRSPGLAALRWWSPQRRRPTIVNMATAAKLIKPRAGGATDRRQTICSRFVSRET